MTVLMTGEYDDVEEDEEFEEEFEKTDELSESALLPEDAESCERRGDNGANHGC